MIEKTPNPNSETQEIDLNSERREDEAKIETNEGAVDLKVTKEELELLGDGLLELSLNGRVETTGGAIDQAKIKILLQKIDKIENSITR